MARIPMTADEVFEESTIVCPHSLTEDGAVFFQGHLSQDAANDLLARSPWAPMWVLSPRHVWATFDRHAPDCDEPCECWCPELVHLETGHHDDHACDKFCSHSCGCADDGPYGHVRPATSATAGAAPLTMAGWADGDGFVVRLTETYEASLFGFTGSVVRT